MKVNDRRTVVGEGLIGHCVPPNRGERSTRMQDLEPELRDWLIDWFMFITDWLVQFDAHQKQRRKQRMK